MDYKDKREEYFATDRNEMLEFLPNDAKKVLDVGCGIGTFAKSVKKKNDAEVWGIELMEIPAKSAAKVLDKVFTGPCEEYITTLPDNYFDAIYFNDVLEHLVDPYEVLAKLKNKLSKDGVIISSIPNVRYHSVLKQLLFNKNWKYEHHGVLDRTHLRFFTKKSIKAMYKEAGYQVDKHHGINRSRSLKPWLYNIFLLFTQLDIFYSQYVTIARNK